MKKILCRLRSKVVWVSIISQVVLIIALFNDEVASEVKIISTAVLEMVTMFGVLNNPDDCDNF